MNQPDAMTTIAVVSQTSRLAYAVAWLEMLDEPVVLIVADARLVDVGTAPNVTVVATGASQPSAERLTRARARRWLRSWAVRGSRTALVIEGTARRLLWFPRRVDWAVSGVRRRHRAGLGDGAGSPVGVTVDAVLAAQGDRVEQIVCFDVFDLPTVLAVTDQRGLHVVVR